MNEERKLRDLKKSAIDTKLAGICGGFGEYTPVPSWLWRVIFFVSLFVGGLGLITYLVLWLFMPSSNAPAVRQERVVNP